MGAEKIQALLEASIADSQAFVEVNGNHIMLTVVSDAFEGLTPVKKQQLVYGAINELIASGEVHAVDSMKTLTKAQWANLA